MVSRIPIGSNLGPVLRSLNPEREFQDFVSQCKLKESPERIKAIANFAKRENIDLEMHKALAADDKEVKLIDQIVKAVDEIRVSEKAQQVIQNPPLSEPAQEYTASTKVPKKAETTKAEKAADTVIIQSAITPYDYDFDKEPLTLTEKNAKFFAKETEDNFIWKNKSDNQLYFSYFIGKTLHTLQVDNELKTKISSREKLFLEDPIDKGHFRPIPKPIKQKVLLEKYQNLQDTISKIHDKFVVNLNKEEAVALEKMTNAPVLWKDEKGVLYITYCSFAHDVFDIRELSNSNPRMLVQDPNFDMRPVSIPKPKTKEELEPSILSLRGKVTSQTKTEETSTISKTLKGAEADILDEYIVTDKEVKRLLPQMKNISYIREVKNGLAIIVYKENAIGIGSGKLRTILSNPTAVYTSGSTPIPLTREALERAVSNLRQSILEDIPLMNKESVESEINKDKDKYKYNSYLWKDSAGVIILSGYPKSTNKEETENEPQIEHMVIPLDEVRELKKPHDDVRELKQNKELSFLRLNGTEIVFPPLKRNLNLPTKFQPRIIPSQDKIESLISAAKTDMTDKKESYDLEEDAVSLTKEDAILFARVVEEPFVWKNEADGKFYIVYDFGGTLKIREVDEQIKGALVNGLKTLFLDGEQYSGHLFEIPKPMKKQEFIERIQKLKR